MLPTAVIALGPLALVIVGLALLGAHSRLRWRACGSRVGPVKDAIWSGLRVLGWAALLVGLFAAIMLMTQVFFPVAWLATAVVLLAMLCRYRNMERRSLLWALMLAAERGFPLESAARAFADERNDYLARRAQDLADYLEAGLPLGLALRRARFAVPPAILLAADLGQQTGNLGPALRQVLQRDAQSEIVLQSAVEKLFYLAVVVVFGLAIWVFLLLNVVPQFEKILHDFGSRPPAITQTLIGVSRFAANYWFLLVPLFLLLLYFLLGGLLNYIGAPPRHLPGLGGLLRRADSALVLRWLAVAVRRQRPIAEMMRLLAGYFPWRGMRRRLEWAAKRIDEGADWSETLGHAGLIGRPEIAVFRSAERTGNLVWALEEMADSRVRRGACRLRAFLSVAFPVVILVLGGCVLLVALGIFTPMIELIQGLA
jgi:type II secretory pathway component PulF